MRGKFDYCVTYTVNAQLDIESIGDCAIQANNDKYESYILIIKTEMGRTHILEFGPILIDAKSYIPSNFKCNYRTFEYSESRIHKAIEAFLRTSHPDITQAEVVSYEEALNQLPDIAQAFDSQCVGGAYGESNSY